MKRRVWGILVLLLVMMSTAALAGDYGKAIIDAPSGKLHLREQPSANSDSMGLFFTGTQVSLKSEPENGWVQVKIGRENGYMSTKYLKTGKAAERVEAEFWPGTVQANQYARMRKGPSTEYQFIRNINDGEPITIMGQTDEGWYYIQYKNDKGFIAPNLVYTRGAPDQDADDDDDAYDPWYEEVYEDFYRPYEPVKPIRPNKTNRPYAPKLVPTATPTPVPTATPAPTYGWQKAYRSYVQNKTDSGDTFALIYVDDDNVPELVIDSGVEAEGCRILTYDGRQVNVLNTRRLGFTYIERGNRLCNSDGHQDSYFDDVYEIRNGRWVCVARGEYYGYLAGWSDVLQRYICRYYVWNNKQTTIDQYLVSLSSVYDGQRAVGVEEGYSRSAILSLL